ncbi:glycoside hydrolase family 18 protein [Mycena olivaceomarginata]|nr:glycoside hydrolase family 18 protein [Mycena olivaceomarginata]
MVSFSLARFLSISSVFLCFARVNSVAVNATIFDGLDQQARDILARATPAAPHWVIYSDPICLRNHWTACSIRSHEGAFDKAFEWTTLTDAQRASVKAQYNAAGIKLVVSVFGSTDVPTSSGVNPVTMATTMANWVKQFNLDGIDVDYEDFNAFDAGDGKAEGTYILTHALHAAVGNLIDWYNVQFYNQGATEYTTCANLLTTSSNTWPRTALFQIAASGVPLSKLVIGKPGTTGAADNGFMSTSTLASCLAQAKSQGWNAGAMVWEVSPLSRLTEYPLNRP